ncbi:DUF4083 family protein [Bacillus toyonensis]|uniref:DUF4083 family protein n=1 Tax=Bacillus toyonensis TaxID=155322 RepID=UPI00287813C8|nr:DUF4083 family protein [Bacillus toyonensis]
MKRRGIYKDIGIGGIIYLIIAIGLIILFLVSFILFLKTLLRKNSYKASVLHNIEQLQQENNMLLKELIQVLKEKKIDKL